MTRARRRRRILIIMMVLAAISAVTIAACVGYNVGRRAGSPPSTWKKRTSRIALGRLAISLIAVLAARRIRRRVRGEPMLVPLGLLRGGLARMRS